MSPAHLLEEFTRYLRAERGLAETTAATYRHHVKVYLEFLRRAGRPAATATSETVAMKILTVREVLDELRLTRSQLYYAEEMGKIPPARRLSNGKRFYLTPDLAEIKRRLSEK